MAHVPPPPTPSEIAALTSVARQVDKVATQAAATPLPGPTRNAFAVRTAIPVGPFEVRPFVDRDFVFLTELNNPLKDIMTGGANSNDFMPTGLSAWQICWIMTRPAKQVKAQLVSGGAKSVNEAAEEVFGDLTMFELSDIIKAVIDQLTAYWAPALEFGVAPQEGEKSPNPPAPVTATAG